MSIMRRFVYIFFRIFFRIDFIGASNIPATGPVVLASNHPSFMDPILVQMGTDRWVRFLGMKEIVSWPVVGLLARAFGMLQVGESPRAGGHALWQAMTVLEQGGVVGMYPEGGRTDGGVMGPAKAGLGRLALHAGVAVVPVVIFGSGRAWPKEFALPAPWKIVVAYLPPMRFSGEPTRERFQEIADEVRARIVEVQQRYSDGPALPGSRAAGAPGY
jgi:1-acyl-sn-glycerol-3-phosphate acyltransferase